MPTMEDISQLPASGSATELRPGVLPGVAILSAHYRRQRFSRHTHDGYALGVIEEGALGFDYRGAAVVAAAGMVNLVVPGEPHDGHAADPAGWRYRMFYFAPHVLRDAAAQIADGPRDLPWFSSGVLHDEALAARVLRTHRCLRDPGASLLERESLLLALVTDFIRRHADDPPPEKTVGREAAALARVRDAIHSRYAESVSLEDLSGIAGLSPYHLIRAFCSAFGLTPHAYLVQTRVSEARRRIEAGMPLAAAALESGFFDQSHLNRHFTRIVGISPGRYRNFVQ